MDIFIYLIYRPTVTDYKMYRLLKIKKEKGETDIPKHSQTNGPIGKYEFILIILPLLNLWFVFIEYYSLLGPPWWPSGKESSCSAGDAGLKTRVSKIRKIDWRRKWLATPLFLPGKSHRQWSLVGYRLWGHKRVGHDLAAKQQHSLFSRFIII